jgi:hypothetical protein
MARRIHHMGMTLTPEDHARFHDQAPPLTPEKHDALMKKLGITKQQDEEWHRTHLTLSELRAQALAGTKHINPQALAAGFLAWCVQQGWLRQKGKQYLATQEGETELRQRFGIQL